MNRGGKYIHKQERFGQDVLVVRVPGHHQKTFRPSQFTTPEEMQRAADAYAAQLAKTQQPLVAPPVPRPPRKEDGTGVSGVRRKDIRGKPHFIAEWNDRPNHTLRRTFSIEKYGEVEAFRLACQARTNRE